MADETIQGASTDQKKAAAPAKKVKKPAKPLPNLMAIVTSGTSASGKSTWAKAFVAERAGQGESWLVLSRDDLRLEILRDAGVPEAEHPARLKAWEYGFGNPMEAKVHGKWLSAIRRASKERKGIVFADTHLDAGRSAKAALAKLGFLPENIQVKLFEISFEDAISRDAGRPFSVGREVLAKQFSAFARSVALRGLASEAPLTWAWGLDPASGFEMPKSLRPKAEKPAKQPRQPQK